MWQAIVLGTAQDGGVPHFGCYRSCCQRAREDRRRRRLVACLGLLNPVTGQAFLLDATPDIREQVDRLRAAHPTRPGSAPVDGILLTHAHIGHYTGLIQLSKEVLNSRDLPVYCTARMAAFLSDNAPWDQLVRDGNIALQTLNSGEPISLSEGLHAEPITVPHRAEYTDTLAFRFTGQKTSLLYVPDIDSWERWERDLAGEIAAVDYALLDGTFYSPAELPWRDMAAIGHPCIADTMQRLGDRRDVPAARVYFTHLNHTNPVLDQGRAERTHVEARGYYIADDGLSLDIS